MAQIMALVVKEFLALLRDKRSRFVLFVPPVVQLLVFGYAATFDLNDLNVAIYDEDRSGESRQLVARIEGSPHFHVQAYIDHDAAIAPLIDNRRVLLVVHIGQRFGSDLRRGRSTAVQVILDGRNSNTAMIALNYLRAIVIDFDRRWLREARGVRLPSLLTVRAWYNENLSSRWFIVPGIVGLLTLVVTLVVTALSVAREREAGTFDQLLVTPLTPFQILLGKALPGIVIGILEGSLIILLAVFWFEVPLLGSLAALYLGLLLFLMSAIGIGLMISSLSVTQQQAVLGAFLFLVPAVILSGFATPIANMPEVVQWLTLLDPLRYFLRVVRGVFLEGAGMGDLLSQYWPMGLMGLVTLSLAAWLFRHRSY
ncbi:MAG TPA: ABC transporter permease [Gammaproteobacteria bacterium]|nr:ABC transporter permease [Gammaproteobacteria bacterium]